MAVDIVLVLRSEHRRIQQHVDRCGRTSRGFHDPAAELQEVLRAHVLAATADLYPAVAKACPAGSWPAETLTAVRALLEQAHPQRQEMTLAAELLVAAEEDALLPVLEQFDLGQRRRLGKMFRIRRDGGSRRSVPARHRHRSQTELYEMARRAGVQHRSRMTQVQLQAALDDLAQRG